MKTEIGNMTYAQVCQLMAASGIYADHFDAITASVMVHWQAKGA